MTMPEDWLSRLKLPLLIAPMFLVSTVELVVAASRKGAIGTVPRRMPGPLKSWTNGLIEFQPSSDRPMRRGA